MMKLMILGLISAFTLSAQAIERHPINTVRTLNFNGTQLDFSYVTGGGCETHTPEVAVNLVQVSRYSYAAEVTIIDSTPSPDYCEAMVPIYGTIDLKALIKAKALAAGYKGNYIDVILPQISMNID